MWLSNSLYLTICMYARRFVVSSPCEAVLDSYGTVAQTHETAVCCTDHGSTRWTRAGRDKYRKGEKNEINKNKEDSVTEMCAHRLVLCFGIC